MKMKAVVFSETVVTFYWVIWHHISENKIFIVTAMRTPDLRLLEEILLA
jgi:hypothetical protein